MFWQQLEYQGIKLLTDLDPTNVQQKMEKAKTAMNDIISDIETELEAQKKEKKFTLEHWNRSLKKAMKKEPSPQKFEDRNC